MLINANKLSKLDDEDVELGYASLLCKLEVLQKKITTWKQTVPIYTRLDIQTPVEQIPMTSKRHPSHKPQS